MHIKGLIVGKRNFYFATTATATATATARHEDRVQPQKEAIKER